MNKFKKDLERGDVGEALFLAANPNLVKLPGFKSDFVDIVTGEKYELKTDYHKMETTKNFFIEIWSDLERLKPGGPRQALIHGSKYLCYMFIADKIYFKMDVQYLVDYLAEFEDKYRKIEVQNDTWTTEGILIPREDLKYEKITL